MNHEAHEDTKADEPVGCVTKDRERVTNRHKRVTKGFNCVTKGFNCVTTCRKRVTTCNERVTTCRKRVTKCNERVTKCNKRVTTCDERVTKCDERVTKCAKFLTNRVQLRWRSADESGVMIKYPPPMTAAERQRKCRAGGKGRHRGGPQPVSRVEAQRLRQEAIDAAAAIIAAEETAPAEQAGAGALAA
jgi:hypothetical protein